MKHWIIATALCCSALATSCGQSPGQPEPDLRGASSQAFEVSPGVTVTTATYRVTGPGGFISAGTASVGSTAFVTVTLAGVPLGTGYEIELTATASDGITTCVGTTPFNVTSTSPVSVVVELICGVPVGTVNVTTTLNICPMVDSLDIAPAEARIGGHLTLTATAHDSDTGPSALSYRWRANGSLLPGSTQSSLTFTCTSIGNVTLALSAFDGDIACNQSLTQTVVCSP